MAAASVEPAGGPRNWTLALHAHASHRSAGPSHRLTMTLHSPPGRQPPIRADYTGAGIGAHVRERAGTAARERAAVDHVDLADCYRLPTIGLARSRGNALGGKLRQLSEEAIPCPSR